MNKIIEDYKKIVAGNEAGKNIRFMSRGEYADPKIAYNGILMNYWDVYDCMDDELTVDGFIRGRMKKVVDGGIGTMIESRAKSFVDELRKRYDMAFATFIVDNMRKQNMLKEDKIAELLKDNPNEK